jgi:hypothetical protein
MTVRQSLFGGVMCLLVALWVYAKAYGHLKTNPSNPQLFCSWKWKSSASRQTPHLVKSHRRREVRHKIERALVQLDRLSRLFDHGTLYLHQAVGMGARMEHA